MLKLGLVSSLAFVSIACASMPAPAPIVETDAPAAAKAPASSDRLAASPEALPASPVVPAASRPKRKLVSEGMLPENFPVYAAGGAVVNHPTNGFSQRGLLTANEYKGDDGCYVACYSHDARDAAYDVGGDIYVKGQVRVEGGYDARICKPKGFEDADISAAQTFKDTCSRNVASCRAGGCWAGGDTGGWFGIQEDGSVF